MPVIERVVDKLLLEIKRNSRRRASAFCSTMRARRWLAEKGYDPKMGARPMARLMQEQIKRPLAEELLFGKLAAGGTVKIGCDRRRQGTRADHAARRDAGASRDAAWYQPILELVLMSFQSMPSYR